MMEPDVRIKTNELGFCRTHFDDMLGMKNRLSVALMLESHMDEVAKSCFGDTKGLFSRSCDPDKTATAAEKAVSSCFVCSHIDDMMGHAVDNAIHMWKTEPDFRKLLDAQDGLCLPHLAELLRLGKRKLSKDEFRDFAYAAISAAQKRHAALRADLAAFSKSFDYRFADAGKEENVKTSVENAVAYLASVRK